MASDRLSFEGRVALVTGAGRGLGRAYAVELARRGAKVVVNDLGTAISGSGTASDVADQVVAEIRKEGGEAVADYGSVTRADDAGAMVETAIERFGAIDVVVCNAGSLIPGSFEEVPAEQFLSIMDVHLMGTVHPIKAAWPFMRERGYGRIVMTTSSAGMWGLEVAASYCAGKGAVFGLTKALALEGRPFGIRVNAIAPGARTRMTDAAFEGRSGWTWRPELVAPAVLYLASESCRHSGLVVSAMGGLFARAETVQAAGHRFDARGDVTPEDFVEHIEKILDLSAAAPLADGLAVTFTGK